MRIRARVNIQDKHSGVITYSRMHTLRNITRDAHGNEEGQTVVNGRYIEVIRKKGKRDFYNKN